MDTAIQGLQGIRFLQDIEQADVSRDLATAKMKQIEDQRAQALRMQEELGALAAKKDVKSSDYISMITKYPALSEQLKLPFEVMNTNEKRETQRKALNVFSAIEGGQTDVAKSILQEQLDASINSGDKQGENSAKAMLKIIDANPDAAKTTAGLLLASTMDEKEFSDTLQKILGIGKGFGYEGNIGAFVADRVQEANDIAKEVTGKPLTNKEIAKIRPAAALEFKRAQAEEIAANTLSKDIATAQNAELIAYNKMLGERNAEIGTAYKLLKAKGEITPMESSEKARARMGENLSTLVDYYTKLDRLGGIVNAENNTMSNIWARAKNAKIPQAIQSAMGTDEQQIRNAINNIKPILIQDIRQSTQMSARGLDSERELDFYLKAVTSETSDLQSNIATALLLDKAYGEGLLYDKIAPQLSTKTKEFLNESLKEGNRIRNGALMKPEEKAEAIKRMTDARNKLSNEELTKLNKQEQIYNKVSESAIESPEVPLYLKELGIQ
jgi:hypothetical protein